MVLRSDTERFTIAWRLSGVRLDRTCPESRARTASAEQYAAATAIDP
jgi:hypothetical protein